MAEIKCPHSLRVCSSACGFYSSEYGKCSEVVTAEAMATLGKSLKEIADAIGALRRELKKEIKAMAPVFAKAKK